MIKRRINKSLILNWLLIFLAGVIFGFCANIALQKIQQKQQIKESLSVNSEESFWKIFNEYRQKNNLPQLQINEGLCKVAEVRAKEVSANWSHENWSAFDLFKECKTCYHFGENLGMYYNHPQNLLNAWIESPSHKANLDNIIYKFGCLGVFKTLDNGFYTALELAG